MARHEQYLYTESHEWVEATGDVRRMGITDHAQHLLGDIVYTELPKVGMVVKKGDPFVTVESPKAAAEVYAPIDGEVVEVNTALESAPETINQSPYEDGWIAVIRPASGTNEGLIDLDRYRELTEG